MTPICLLCGRPRQGGLVCAACRDTRTQRPRPDYWAHYRRLVGQRAIEARIAAWTRAVGVVELEVTAAAPTGPVVDVILTPKKEGAA